MKMFALIFALFILMLNLFTAIKTIKYIVPSYMKVYAAIIFTVLFFMLLFYQIFNVYFSENFSYTANKTVSYIIYYYLGFLIYCTMVYIITWILQTLFYAETDFNFYKPAFVVVLIILVIGSFYKNSTVITSYEVDGCGKFSKPLNIVLVSDVHLGYINGNSSLKKMSRMINSLNPDVVLIAGDLIDMSLKPVLEKNMLKELENIKSKYGVYFALGNHDMYRNKSDILSKGFEKITGANILRDEKILINDDFYIMGRDDFSKMPLKNIINEDKKPVILIQHTPNRIDEAEEENIFLQVSGHTHKGQMFPGRLFTKRIFPLDYGYKKFKNTNVVVSSGYGTWGPPIRIGSRSEIVEIKIK